MNPATLTAAVGCLPLLAEQFAPYIEEACAAFGIGTDVRLAAFLAQIGHESGSFRYTEELASGEAYEGRADLGNTQPGDGKRYRGHGLIQITGRANHVAVRNALANYGCPDFEAEPEALTQPRWAALSAGWYWQSHGCNELADEGDFERITRKINGGMNGYEDRMKRWNKASAVLGVGRAPVETRTPIPTQPEKPMLPLIPIFAALLPTLIEAVPKLGTLFGSGSEVSTRNVKAAEMVFDVAQKALGATNAQEVAQRVQADPAAAQIVRQAVADNWFTLTEAGGGGIEGARKADVAFVSSGGRVWHSPSFWAMCLLLPLVYMIVGAMTGLWGTLKLTPEVTASIITGIVTLIIGGAGGYYFGSATSANKPAPAPTQ